MRNLSRALFCGLLALPSVALAGGCPTCTTSADCMPPGGGEGFCVEWSRDFGCGPQRVACCPGQACDTFSGRPSCEGADSDGDGADDCTIFGGAMDAGPAAADGGPGAADAGPTRADGGPAVTDAGGATPDAGPTPVTEGGCGCRATGRSSAGGLVDVSLFALVALAWRRR